MNHKSAQFTIRMIPSTMEAHKFRPLPGCESIDDHVGNAGNVRQAILDSMPYLNLQAMRVPNDG